MSSIDEYLCAAGYYCLKGSTLEEPPTGTTYATGIMTTPVHNNGTTYSETSTGSAVYVNGGPCPIQYECRYTMIHMMTCEDGFISQEEGLSQCSSCPSDYYCDMDESQADPIQCITQSVCNSAEKRQPICPAGTFMNEGDQYCQKCTAGNYCRAGIIAESCAAGYLCSEPEFHTQPDPAGYECEIGDYCPRGTTVAIPCPFETQSVMAEARQATDCVACQPGYLCEYGERNATECPAGHYCPPKADDKVYKGELYPCEAGTYNPWTKKIYQHDCLDCDMGYYCNETGIANITGMDCPAGYFCPPRTVDPFPCPAGTYQSSIGAIEEDSCEGCPLGKYCPEGAAYPHDCEDGYFCPYRAAAPVTCSGGYYCNEDTRYQEEECPVNSYCPRGSKLPLPCDDKHTCPGGSEAQIFCENGYYVDTSPSRYGGLNLCKKCAIGTYSISDTTGCLPCPPGYLCYGGTNTNTPISVQYHKGEICPKGAYCPEGSYDMEFCEPGTYNPNFGAGSKEGCLLCEAGTSNPSYGQEGCSPCGQFADSLEGSEECGCIGKNRVYSPVDNSCRCRTGFDFKNADSVSEGQSSDITDCIPLVMDRCDGADEVRAPDGSCKGLNDCEKECNGNTGVRDKVLGVCACDNTPTTDELCNQDCRSSAPTLGFQPGSASQLKVTDSNGDEVELNLNNVGDVLGAPTGNGALRTVSLSGNGYQGSYDTPAAWDDAYPNEDEDNVVGGVTTTGERRRKIVKKRTKQSKRRTRELQAQANVAPDAIPNPVYCVTEGDNFMFNIESPKAYPVYQKNSVMNSNLKFDYGAFKDLQTEMNRKISQGDTAASIFTFTFTEAGNYVFEMSNDASQLLIVTVKGPGETCADPDRYLQVMSGETLARFGVSQRSDIIVKPNYPLLVSMVCIGLFGTAFTMLMVHYCMHKGWNIKDLKNNSYRDNQTSVNIHHENERVFVNNNDFVKHKAEDFDHEEEELDNCNLDIQQDLVDAGKKYLHKYNKRKAKHKKQKVQKKKQV